MNRANNNSDEVEERLKEIRIDHSANNSLLDTKARIDSNMKNREDPEGRKRIYGMAVDPEPADESEGSAPLSDEGGK